GGGVGAPGVAGADVVLGVPGARVSSSGPRPGPAGIDPASPEFGAAAQWQHGFVDALAPAAELGGRVATVLGLLSPRSRGADCAPVPGPLGGRSQDASAEDASQVPRDAWAQVSAAPA